MRRLIAVAVMLAALPVIPARASIPEITTENQIASEQEQIVGGRNATRPYPFMASLQRSTGAHRCGASLVRKWWVLTAKHCVEGFSPQGLQIMLGSQKRSAPGQIHQLSEIRMMPGVSDTAVLKLATPSTLEPIRIAGLDEKATWAPGTLATALGWGTEFFLSPTIPDQLKEVELHIVSDPECDRVNGFIGFNPETEVCAGELEGGRDTCQGDSGGPLLVPDARGRFIVMGTTFYGLGCGLPGGAYGVYARVGDNTIRAWLDANLPPESSLSVENTSTSESNSSLAFTVRKAGTAAKAAKVNFTTADGTATAGSDYWPISGTLVFEPDDKTQTVFVPILGDAVDEPDETVVLKLSGPVEAEIEVATATGTITDDD